MAWYAGIIEAQREAIETTGKLDQVTQDMLIKHSGELEQFHWQADEARPPDRARPSGVEAAKK